MTLALDSATLAEARSFNRKLHWAPRFKIDNCVIPLVIQSLLRLSQFGADGKLARDGIRVTRRTARSDGLDVPVRILRGAAPARGVVLDFHGGGWAIGNAAMNDQLNARMIAACDVAVVSVDYRLAPAAPLAAIMDDCLAAARWLLEGGLPEYDGLPLYILGESAGGHLAAATLLQLKDWPDLLRRITGAIMYYGVYDLAGTPSVRQAGADTLVLHGPSMLDSLRLLTPGLTDEQRRQSPQSPLYGDLSGMPPALMFAGERDPLRDDTLLMAERWRTVTEVECHVLPEAPHGFIRFPTRMAAQVRQRAYAWIRARQN
ncbi:alpha/beta hydrolase fold domain-containing protein [Pseudoduganella sp. FT26W]|uniref:Alpha/beta hydrolase fold domain-containing protein n=1 Tax=Duganella aquatilis TaxID=2666082 RepID=A0A844D3G6_9BURK|nr:alpha/beta hydrolase [Duganella aquatilis]MRW82686.1 alpha/beta hydrolase fold domain-containing protein [Duganella aquatilis]